MLNRFRDQYYACKERIVFCIAHIGRFVNTNHLWRRDAATYRNDIYIHVISYVESTCRCAKFTPVLCILHPWIMNFLKVFDILCHREYLIVLRCNTSTLPIQEAHTHIVGTV